jgi:hypothetical protein
MQGLIKRKFMELVLARIAKRKTYTIGKLYIVEKVDDEYLAGEKQTYLCDTLEPTALELKTSVSKETVLRSPKKAESLKPFAIPEGRYAVVITWSPKFKQWLPVLLGGPDFNHLFKGIRIHAGNTAEDTAGCILVGRNQTVGRLYESRKWLYEVKQKIVDAKGRGEAVWLTIQ